MVKQCSKCKKEINKNGGKRTTTGMCKKCYHIDYNKNPSNYQDIRIAIAAGMHGFANPRSKKKLVAEFVDSAHVIKVAKRLGGAAYY